MIPKIIHQIWFGERDYRKLYNPEWIDSWKELNPHYEYIVHTETDAIKVLQKYPKYYEVFKKLDAKRNLKYALRSDFLRYLLMYEYGGIYVDMDFECYKPIDPLIEEYKNEVILGRLGNNKKWIHSVPNSILFSKPKSEFWIYVLNTICEKNLKGKIGRLMVEKYTGPIMLKQCTDSYDDKSMISLVPSEYLYPMSWKKRRGVVYKYISIQKKSLEERRNEFSDAYAATYWGAKWN